MNMIDAELYFSHRNIRLLKLRKHFVYYHQKVTDISYSSSIYCNSRRDRLFLYLVLSKFQNIMLLFNKLQDFETMKARKEELIFPTFRANSRFYWHVLELIQELLFAEKLYLTDKSVNAEFRLSVINMFFLSIA